MPSRRVLLTILAAAALALAAVALLRLRREPPSDEEAIRALFDGVARAAEERRPSDAVAGVSERFRGRGIEGGAIDRDGAKRIVALHVLRGEWVSVTVSSARVAVAGDAARANVDVLLVRGSGKGKAVQALLPGEASAHRFRCGLEREPEGWRVVEAEWRPIGLADAIAGPPDP